MRTKLGQLRMRRKWSASIRFGSWSLEPFSFLGIGSGSMLFVQVVPYFELGMRDYRLERDMVKMYSSHVTCSLCSLHALPISMESNYIHASNTHYATFQQLNKTHVFYFRFLCHVTVHVAHVIYCPLKVKLQMMSTTPMHSLITADLISRHVDVQIADTSLYHLMQLTCTAHPCK